jgi:L-amino acid N-acyltransferase YncA
MPEISIRHATTSDAAAIAAVYNHYVLNSTATFDTDPKSAADREWWLSDRDPRHPVIVAERGPEVVGWAALGPYRERPAWLHTSEVAVYVAAAERGSGIGSTLLVALVEEASALGLHALISQVVGGNEPSLRIAERLGFERVGVLREVGRKFGTWLDVVIMELVLPQPEGASGQ